jgi:hypothetical protein
LSLCRLQLQEKDAGCAVHAAFCPIGHSLSGGMAFTAVCAVFGREKKGRKIFLREKEIFSCHGSQNCIEKEQDLKGGIFKS